MGALCRSPTVLRSTLPDEPPLDGKGASDPFKGGALCTGKGPKAALVGRKVVSAHGSITSGQVDDAEAIIPLEMKLRRERCHVAVMRGNDPHRKAQGKAEGIQESGDLAWLRTTWAEGFKLLDDARVGGCCHDTFLLV